MFSISGTKTAKRTIDIGPSACGISLRGGECYDSGIGLDWHRNAICKYDPTLTAFQARALCAGSILMQAGHVTGLRRARLSKSGGYSYFLDPSAPIGHRWTRDGFVAGPIGTLP